MKLPFTKKMLMDWAGARVLREAESLFNQGYVQEVVLEPPFVRGSIARGNRPLKSGIKIQSDGHAENLCPCYDSTERGIVCVHAIALCLAALEQANDPDREDKLREETRRAARQASLDEAAYIQRVPPDTPGATPASLVLSLERGWKEQGLSGRMPIRVRAEYHGRQIALDEMPTDVPFTFSPKDDAILYVLEDISEGPARSRLELLPADFINLLSISVGRHLYEEGSVSALTVNAARMNSALRVDLDRENGELLLSLHTELPFMKPGEFPVYIISRKAGWVYGAGHFWPLERILPEPLHPIYDQPIHIERGSAPRFLQVELPVVEKLITVETDISIDLFTIEPGTPAFRLRIKGSPASLAATLYADYDGVQLIAGKSDPAGHFAHPDPSDLMRYTVRNTDAEHRALARLNMTGLDGDAGDRFQPIVGNRQVLNFLGSHVPALKRLGWRVELEGRVSKFMDDVDYAAPVVHVADASSGWFEVGFQFEDRQGASLSVSDIQRAIRRGDSYIERDGRVVLFDSDAIQSMTDVFRDCRFEEGSAPGHFRLADVYSAYVKSSLDAMDGIDVEAAPEWRARAEKHNRLTEIAAIKLPAALDQTLRSYQKEGVHWLRFLEANGFSGILADEMGLGKTLQTLVWIYLERQNSEFRDKPALIICPTSLVGNWAEEAARFVPDLKVIEITGTDRHVRWSKIDTSDIVITSYALLRRDINRYVGHEFAAVVLDEAQHIKNRSTQNAVAAKRLKAGHRLVLTGTPIENSVSDLWSIMDFLMPGYLGSHDSFKKNYESPIAQGGPYGEAAQRKLRRKLHPFLLRRLKTEVARDLPPRIERLASCTLSRDQQMVYKEYLNASRRRISDLVSRQGFNRSRMEILKTLLRLRQVCCHLDLLKLPDLKSKFPSEKMNLLMELLDEAMDAGHRVLIFSQFTTMLKILAKELAAQDVRYCYLDGSTEDRMAVVHEFNTTREIPIFLISLKAGGTGLNLTGADMVIHYDPWWNPAVEDQATDRAHRIGQKKTVYSVKLITRDTVEEKVLAMQKKKKSVIDATLSSDDEIARRLSWDDIRELLDME